MCIVKLVIILLYRKWRWVILTPFFAFMYFGSCIILYVPYILFYDLCGCLNGAIEICWPKIPHWPYYDLLGLKPVTSFSFLSCAHAQAYTINFDECITHKTHFTNADSDSVKWNAFPGVWTHPWEPSRQARLPEMYGSKFSMTLTHAAKTQICSDS